MTTTKEQQIEQDLIQKLESLGYQYNQNIRTQEALNANFREKFNTLNKVNLSDCEFNRLKTDIITPDVFASSQLLRQVNSFEREDGTPLNYTLVNIKDWCKNSFEVINQLRINTKNSHHRYDVILLINGIPLVQIELKMLGINTRRAMAQIVDYKNDAGNGYANTLLAFMQLFIVSNETNTFYFTNNNNKHFNFNAEERFLPVYEFAARDNKKITQLDKFADKFLAKCDLAQMISRYMVLLAGEQKLLIMRPYQIYAVKSIVECVDKNDGNGYIWHTTGSGKTLTSFKASTLLKENPNIQKCLFVVDRKDLDKQTRDEFNKFQKNCVEENTNTHTLVKRLISDDYADKVIVTTIQKLGLALNEKNRNNYKKELAPLADKKIVFIFDECHRSQFGENHEAIKTFFPNSQLFGFTGTPIFAENASYTTIENEEATLKTTADIFNKELHNYTITHAIEDKNVLRFNVDYFETDAKQKENNAHSQKAIVEAILNKHHKATRNRQFNALFATQSINHAIEYCRLFKEVQKQNEDENFTPLNIACVFSPPAEGDKDVRQLQEDLPQELADNKENPNEKKEALKTIINDYNDQYETNHTINNFDLYYQDIQQRIKSQQYSNQDHPQSKKIDITIVVDMLLTGFDSKYLSTLYVDKNLKNHGLIQAFSRTNRVLNDTKPYGNIVDFKIGQTPVDNAMILFSGEDKDKAKEIWLVDSAPKVIDELKTAMADLRAFMQAQGLESTPSDVANIKGDEARAGFINHFKAVQRLTTQLDQYTDLEEQDKADIESVISKDDLRRFKGVYLDIAKDLKFKQSNGEDLPDTVENLDFEFVLFANAMIDYDYIMGLLAKYTQGTTKQKITKAQLIALITSDAKFIDEKQEITDYINTLEIGIGLDEKAIKKGYEAFKNQKFTAELTTIAKNHPINAMELSNFVEITLKRKIFDGDLFSNLFSLDLGWKERGDKETELVIELASLLIKQAKGAEISGLSAYVE